MRPYEKCPNHLLLSVMCSTCKNFQGHASDINIMLCKEKNYKDIAMLPQIDVIVSLSSMMICTWENE